jgi:hypothetical protein
MEALEDRALLSTYIANGDIHIDGSTYNDSVLVERVLVQKTAFFKVTHSNPMGNQVSLFQASTVTGGDVWFEGLAGDDTFENTTALRTYASGGDGNDSLRGGSYVNYLSGDDGNDSLWGGVHVDHQYGNDGDDNLYGRGQND